MTHGLDSASSLPMVGGRVLLKGRLRRGVRLPFLSQSPGEDVERGARAGEQVPRPSNGALGTLAYLNSFAFGLHGALHVRAMVSNESSTAASWHEACQLRPDASSAGGCAVAI